LLQSNSGTSGNTFLRTDQTGIFSIINNNTVSCRALANGVFQVMNNNIQNKMLVMYDNDVSETPSTATNFSGIGIQSGGAMRYQTPTATTNHRFFCGSTQSFFISNGTGASGSDIRFKSDIQNITNAMDKINNIQGKSFLFHQYPRRQLGFIAQEIQTILPEVIITDDESEEQYLFMQYDRISALHNEGIKQIYQELQELKNRINILENK
jgi:hypothetical protein